MRLAVDASNLRAGGGVTHLANLLSAADPSTAGISHVGVWGSSSTLQELASRPWLSLQSEPALSRSALARVRFQTYGLSAAIREWGADALFVPGGMYAGSFRPFVTMFRNMLPFAPREAARYGLSPIGLRLRALRPLQTVTFRRAAGVICLSQFAADVLAAAGIHVNRAAIVPHGIDDAFRCAPRHAQPLTAYSVDNPFKLLYVSIIDVYKHQWSVAEAVARLRQRGLPVSLTLIGPAYPAALRRLEAVNAPSDVVRYIGARTRAELPLAYAQADAFVFASTCENMPNVLLEAMASGLPIACSSRPPMPELLGTAGVYFDPENVDSIEGALTQLLSDVRQRDALAHAAYDAARAYSWQRCAEETFAFVRGVVN